ncbi:MAG: hypothetical protein ACI8QZ_001365 [Chlamydiales bacterium]|jgi:hypothetical protein
MNKMTFVFSSVASLALATTVTAQDIPADCDCWTTEPGTQARIPNLDADFFGPGSDPFPTGVIPVIGNPGPIAAAAAALCPPTTLLDVVWVDPHGTPVAPDDRHAVRQEIVGPDTIVCRTTDGDFGGIGVPEPIQIELVELSLVSEDPITVTFSGGVDFAIYDVFITEQGVQLPGQMTLVPGAIGTNTSSGTAILDGMPVRYLLTFVKVQGAQGAPVIPLGPLNLDLMTTGPPGTFTYTGPPPPGGIPAMGPMGLVALSICLLGIGALVLRRRVSVAS